MDLSRDYAPLFEEVLREQGVKTRVDIFPGLPHGFWSFFPKVGFTKDLREKTDAGLMWLLQEGKANE
jgi:acetyl esterase/lipase